MPGEKRHRALQQIKDVQRNITLRNPEALAPLARFFAHQRLNPAFNLEFVYITTASVTRERSSACSEPLIAYWTSLQTDNSLTTDACFEQLRTTVRTAPRPDGVTDEDWMNFSSFFSSARAQDIVAFVRKVRWLVMQPGNQDLKLRIEDMLVERSLCPRVDAGRAYAQLVVYVAEVLSRSGAKQLGGEDLAGLLEQASAQKDTLDLILALESFVAAVQVKNDLLQEDIEPNCRRSEPHSSSSFLRAGLRTNTLQPSRFPLILLNPLLAQCAGIPPSDRFSTRSKYVPGSLYRGRRHPERPNSSCKLAAHLIDHSFGSI